MYLHSPAVRVAEDIARDHAAKVERHAGEDEGPEHGADHVEDGAHGQRPTRCSQSTASASRSILPFAFLGMASTMTTPVGTLKDTSLARQCSSSDASGACRRDRRATKPTGTSP